MNYFYQLFMYLLTYFFKACMADACRSQGSQELLENHLAAYADACKAAGSVICDWRKLCKRGDTA